MKYQIFADSFNNRLRIDKSARYYQFTDEQQTKLYHFDRMKLYLSNEIKGMCLDYDLEDVSSTSLIRRPKGLSLKSIIQEVWNKGSTKYLGLLDIDLHN
jgi:hypothetical protein